MIQLVPVEGETNKWVESDTMGFGDMLLGGLTNPFTGKPSSQAQQWMTIIYATVIGVLLSAWYFSRSDWFKKLAEKEERKLSNQVVGDVAYAAGMAAGAQSARTI